MALLSIQDVAQWLTVKPSTLYAWIAQKKMPALKIHGVIRFRREDIEVWLAGCEIAQREPARLAVQRPRSKDDVDTLIARTKADVYTSCCGKPDKTGPNREVNDGSV